MNKTPFFIRFKRGNKQFFGRVYDSELNIKKVVKYLVEEIELDNDNGFTVVGKTKVSPKFITDIRMNISDIGIKT
jgi:hypothetical protein